ncbi:hypothetical protein H0H81_008492, partial [Sphagnurus paluster]
MQSRRFTRASNADTHPGLPVAPKPRRTSAQVQAEKNAKATAKDKAKHEKTANIAKVAQIKNNTQKKLEEADIEANRPKDKLLIPRASRPVALSGMD